MIESARKSELANRPLYMLSAYVYKAGKVPSDDNVDGTGKDFELYETDFYASGNTIRADGGGAFPVGNVVSKTCTLSLHTSTRYTAADFAGAYIVLIIKADSGGEIWNVTGDYYFVQTVTKEDGKIVLECADCMCKADRLYNYDVEFTTSAGTNTTTYYDIYKSVCRQMGFTPLASPDMSADDSGLTGYSQLLLLTTYSFEVHNLLLKGRYTCREMLGFIAMATLSNAIVEAGAYNIRLNSMLYFKPAASDGSLYTKGHSMADYWFSFVDEAETVAVTGTECTISSEDESGETSTATYYSSTYSNKYALDLSDNPFVIGSNAPVYALDTFYGYLSALSFRKFEGRFMSYPLLEYGDYISAVHLNGSLQSYVTSFEWNVSGGTTIGCDVQTAAENASVYGSSTGGSTSGGGSSDYTLPAATSSSLGGVKVGTNLSIAADGTLSVDMADAIEKDNTKPVSSEKVYTEIGNINALLATI